MITIQIRAPSWYSRWRYERACFERNRLLASPTFCQMVTDGVGNARKRFERIIKVIVRHSPHPRASEERFNVTQGNPLGDPHVRRVMEFE